MPECIEVDPEYVLQIWLSTRAEEQIRVRRREELLLSSKIQANSKLYYSKYEVPATY